MRNQCHRKFEGLILAPAPSTSLVSLTSVSNLLLSLCSSLNAREKMSAFSLTFLISWFDELNLAHGEII